MNYLHKGLETLQIETVDLPTLEADLMKYINELELFNSAYDLTNAENQDDIVIKHVLDSLSAQKKLVSLIKSPDVKIADIGSGGGLPGIPLSLSLRDFNITLVERMSKRCAFLENCTAILGLKNVSIENLEAERVPANSFDIIVFRAFRPLDKKMIKTLARMVKPDGYILAYKAKLEKIKEEMDAIKSLVTEYDIEPLSVPFLTENEKYERNLVIIKREKVLYQFG